MRIRLLSPWLLLLTLFAAIAPARAQEIQITLTSLPAAGPRGGSVLVRATIKNTGDRKVLLNQLSVTFTDTELLAADPTEFYAGFAGELAAGAEIRDKPLLRVTIDPSAAGTYTATVAVLGGEDADALDNLGQQDFPVTVVEPPPSPDLIVREITQAPAQVMAGVPFSVAWVVRNPGAGRASGTWIDRIYLSSDETLDTGADELIGEQSFGGGLDAGQEAARSASAAIPFTSSPGNRFLIVVTDAAGTVAESDEANNIRARALIVEAFRDTTPPDTRFTAGPSDNGKACATTVEFCWTASDDATPAGQLQFSFKLDAADWSAWSADICRTFSGLAPGLHTLGVRARDAAGNVETAPAARSFFVDLTTPTISSVAVDARDYRAVLTWNTSELTTTQAEYGPTAAYGSLTPLDGTMAGAHRIVLTGLTPKTTYHFRVRSSDGCREVQSEDRTFTTTDILPPNLTVTELTFPRATTARAVISVTWRVQNRGQGDATAGWMDRLYLSTDGTLDADDTLLATHSVNTALGEGEDYSRTQSVSIPRKPPGNYLLLLKTDASEALAETNENDNTLALPIEMIKANALVATPDQIPIALRPGVPVTGEIELVNLGDDPLTELAAVVEGAPSGVGVAVSVPATLASMERKTARYTVTADNDAVLQSAPIIRFSSREGEKALVTFAVSVIPNRPQLVATPATLEAGMIRGRQMVVEAEIANTGSATATGLTVSLPAAPWLSLATPDVLADLAPGEKARITLALQPPASLPLGPYNGVIAVNGANAAVAIPFRFRCVSDGRGDLRLFAEDEFTYFANPALKVGSAKVVLKDRFTDAVIVEGVTNEKGEFARGNLPEGFYNLEVTAEKHAAHRSAVEIVAGQEREVRAFLPRRLVTYTWKVEPIETADRYRVDLQAEFETHVPAPVITVTPLVLDLRDTPFDAEGRAVVNYTLSNQGLIAANDVRIAFTDGPGYRVKPLVDSIGRLDALESVVVPVTITRAVAALAADACGSSGGVTGSYKCGGTDVSQFVALTIAAPGCSLARVPFIFNAAALPPTIFHPILPGAEPVPLRLVRAILSYVASWWTGESCDPGSDPGGPPGQGGTPPDGPPLTDQQVRISPNPLVLGAGSAVAVTATGAVNGQPREGTYHWTSSDRRILALEGSGSTLTARGIAPGRVTLTVIYTVTDADGPHTATDRLDVTVARVRLKFVSFAGDHPVVGDDSASYSAPQWRDSNDNGSADEVGEPNFPLCYTRNTKMRAGATFQLEPRGFAGPIKIRGTDLPEVEAVVSEGTVTYPVSETGTALPNRVDLLNPTLAWEFSLDGGATWQSAGASRHRVYVTLRDPLATPLYETVLDIGCRNAAGSTDSVGVVDAIWSDFTDRNVVRKQKDGYNRTDGVQMGYWLGGAVPDFCQILPGMLIDPTGNGSCNAWSQLLQETLRAQGITGSVIVEITPNTIVNPGAVAFLVKRWQFNEPPLFPGEFFPYKEGSRFADLARPGYAVDLEGVPAQKNPDPPRAFENHYVLEYGARIYDPSYGTGPFDSELAHEDAACDGLTSGAKCKKPNPDPAVADLKYTHPGVSAQSHMLLHPHRRYYFPGER